MHRRNHWRWAAVLLASFTLLVLLGAMRVSAQSRRPATDKILIGLVFDSANQAEHVAHIDPATGAATPVGDGAAACCTIIGLDAALDGANGRLYAVLGKPTDTTPRLYTFDIATGSATASQPLTTSAAVYYLTVDPTNGQVLALITEIAANHIRLVQVDPTTGAFTARGAPIANCCSTSTLDSALDANHRRLYAAMTPSDAITRTLYTFDLDTGALLTTTLLSPFVSVNYMVFDDSAGVLRAVVNDPQSGAERLAIIEPATGAITMTGEGAAGCCNLLITDAALDTGKNLLTLPLIGAEGSEFLFTFDVGTGAVIHQPALPAGTVHYVKYYTPPPPPALGMQKQAPEAVGPDATIVYDLNVDNHGGSTATGVVVRDVLPAGATLVAASPGGVLEPATSTQGAALRWPLGALAVNTQGKVSFAMTGSLALVNVDYLVTANDSVQAVGQRPVVTLVGEQISAVDAEIGVTTTTVITAAGNELTIRIPPGAVTSTTSARVVASGKPADPRAFTDLSFNIVLTDAAGSPLLSLLKPITMTVRYDDAAWRAAGMAGEGDLNLYQWQEGSWIPVLPCDGCLQDSSANQFVAVVNKPGLFALRGFAKLYLAEIRR